MFPPPTPSKIKIPISYLGANWFYAPGSLIMADDLFGTTQNWVADGSRDWVMLPAGLTLADFGGVTYYFGLGEGGGGLGTGSQFFATQDGAIAFGQVPEPTSLAILTGGKRCGARHERRSVSRPRAWHGVLSPAPTG